jgi:outer membrane protein OmpA-like peptidoglycan-associated protein
MKYFKRYSSFFVTESQQTPGSENQVESENIDINNNSDDIPDTDVNGNKLTNVEEIALQKELNNWSSKYADKFIFKNAEPRIVTADVVSTIIPANQSAVTEAIDSIIKILSQPKYKSKVDVITIIGHTSSTWGGAPADVAAAKNLKLSEIRATSVEKTIQAKGKDLVAGIKFKSIPKGLTELIIKNDAVEGAAEEGIGGKQIKGGFKFSNLTKPEQKQAINRRVVISLPNFQPKYEITVTNPTDRPVVTKPVVPNPTALKFNFNSYIPTTSSYNLLKEFAANIGAYNKQNVDKITDIYICSHSNKAENKTGNDKTQDKLIFTISLNRAVAVKKVLAAVVTDVKFHIIPASYYVTKTNDPENNKKVEIDFEVTERVNLAKKAFNKLSRKYKIESNNGEYASDNIVINKELRAFVVKHLQKNDVNIGKFIPHELWDETYGKYEPNLSEFKKELINIAGNKDGVEKFLYDLKT